ncbi:mitochondrial chaperone [Mycoblastus sanguinarius]|nr:mitochondrial chaperone [Mycoblastus sanguinarius]
MANDAIPTPTSDAINTPYPFSRSSTEGGFVAQFSDNPFFTGALGVAGLGAVVAIAQKGVRYGASLLKRRLLVDAEIRAKNEYYPWFLQWMTLHHREQTAGWRSFASRMHHLSFENEHVKLSNGSIKTQMALVPGPGKYILRYKNAFIMVNRVRETRSMDFQMGIPFETITLTTLYAHRHVFEDIFAEAQRLAQQSVEGKTVIYTARGTSWEQVGEPSRKRPLDSVILDQGIKEYITNDINEFLGEAKWYYEQGVPYRRGYLLHGPPGTGKTSFIQALAGELDYNIAILNLSERGLTDDRLNYLLTILPRRTLVLLEDADAAFTNRRAQTDDDGYRGANVTYSGLLNALDGVASPEERILFLTTNYRGRLDDAMVRPGRVDTTIRLGELTRWQTSKLWDRFYGGLDGHEFFRARFLQRLEELGVTDSEQGLKTNPEQGASPAALQGLFMRNKRDMEGAISMVPDWLQEIQESRERQNLEHAARPKSRD